ncbi:MULTISPECIES: Arc family DNA-binding protein [unclassified Agrobacterium]|uniref:Arc family DNA-binding protein n=1 Tax=unclassified Agrobacterium TaxID=2632611 RepID=UPI00244A0F33|nr:MULTISPECIES: Arc family DNA-binding protein [unclassified Agrobacterium]MDH0613423.1 Arc family DNA-binding protein [Agrobacterium sp. GD03872]MDH0697340.1 Arc family DNA-binding protein [Agrobacterium sp. GD03871]MDH1060863.1 Arc family DNA-binding protein [Agrobacterium sp. GD03992]MDH2211447.1 Arc family DNA-binding protein [Agrobacterium sp. GD03643]MDH2220706.1 Arc family DNA-binding protein [Agrobacterium sp. GD03638]
MTKKPISQPQDKFIVRLPDGLRERIRASAENQNRSMNADIVARLELSFEGQDLSGKVAYLEGMNDALGRTVRAFIDHLTQTPEGREAVLKAILTDEFSAAIPPDEGL